MKLRSIALVLTIALASAAAHAQSGIYAIFDAQQFTQNGIHVSNDAAGNNTDRPWLLGPTYGVYYDVTHLPGVGKLKTGPILIGFDGRGDIFRLNEYGSQLDKEDGLLSLRISTKKKYYGITPYLQGGFGIGHTRVPFAAHYQNNLLYQGSLGVDRRIFKSKFDWRVIEISGGSLASYKTGVALHESNYMFTVGTGIVFRLP